jgi:hypothetical protein
LNRPTRCQRQRTRAGEPPPQLLRRAGQPPGEGAGIYVDPSGATTAQSIASSTFINDSAGSSEGGGIYISSGALTLTTSTFAYDNAADEGGGIYMDDGSGALSVTNTTVVDNQAGNEGGGVDLSTPAPTIALLNDTIAGNSAYQGGGVYDVQNATAVKNTIVANNNGGSFGLGGGDCYGATPPLPGVDLGGNIDSDGTCFSDSIAGDHTSVNPNLGRSPTTGEPPSLTPC